jgi:hypothetical protein
MQSRPTPFEVALQLIKELLEWQNEPPLESDRTEWQKTTDIADKFLSNYSELLGSLNYTYDEIQDLI